MTERARARDRRSRFKNTIASISRDVRFISDRVFLLILRPTFYRFTVKLFLQSLKTADSRSITRMKGEGAGFFGKRKVGAREDRVDHFRIISQLIRIKRASTRVNEELAAAKDCKNFRDSPTFIPRKNLRRLSHRPPSPIRQNSIRAKRSAPMIFAS